MQRNLEREKRLKEKIESEKAPAYMNIRIHDDPMYFSYYESQRNKTLGKTNAKLFNNTMKSKSRNFNQVQKLMNKKSFIDKPTTEDVEFEAFCSFQPVTDKNSKKLLQVINSK